MLQKRAQTCTNKLAASIAFYSCSQLRRVYYVRRYVTFAKAKNISICRARFLAEYIAEARQFFSAAFILFYRTLGVVSRLEARSVTCDNAQLPMLSELCS